MDKRFFLALLLSLVVVALSQVLFPTQVKKEPSAAAGIVRARSDSLSATEAGIRVPPNGARPVSTDSAATGTQRTEKRTTVSTGKAIYTLTNVGASPVSVVMKDYANRSAAGGQ